MKLAARRKAPACCLTRFTLSLSSLAGVLLLACLGPSLAAEPAPDPEEPASEPEKAAGVSAAPKSEFSITMTDNPSTGYTLSLKSMSRGIFFLYTDPVQEPEQPLPGASSQRTFHFFNSLDESGEDAPEITFARFQVFDLENSYIEENYVVEIRMQQADAPSDLGAKYQVVRGGLKLTSIDPESLAQKLRLRQGDVLTQINGDPIKKITDIVPALAKTMDQLLVHVISNGGTMKLSLPWPADNP